MSARGLRIVVFDRDSEQPRQLARTGTEMAVGWALGRVILSAPSPTGRQQVVLRWTGKDWTALYEDRDIAVLIDGIPIKGEHPVTLKPGARMSAGGTEWFVIPLDWLALSCDALLLYGPFVGEYGCAQYHCGLPVVGALTAENAGTARSVPAAVEWSVPGYAAPCSTPVPALSPGERVQFEAPALRLDPDKLRSFSVASGAMLRVRFQAQDAVEAEFPLTLLGAWEWSYRSGGATILPAFVSPRDGAVEAIVHAAQDEGKNCGVPPFHTLLRTEPQGERCVAQRLYNYISSHYILFYINPNIKRHGCLARQCIQPPYRLVPTGQHVGSGYGTCLDLALLFAGCIENAGLCPVLVLTGVRPDDPQHVLGGWWAGRTCGGRPLLTDPKGLREEVAEGNLALVECTGFAEGAFAQGRLGFENACTAAVRHVMEARWLVGIDVVALRPPLGNVTPMEWPLAPEVDHAYRLARAFARRKGRAVLETTYLLYGVLSAGGEVTQWLFEAFGRDPGQICRELERRVPGRESEGEPVPTRHTQECMHLAAQFAWRRGIASVCEQDLLWAMLRRAEEPGSAFQTTCEKLRLEPRQLGAILAQRFPHPDGPCQCPSAPSVGLE